MLKIGDTIMQVKSMGSFNFVGKEFKVTSVDNDIIEFVGLFDMGWGVKGGISEMEFEKYFEKVEPTQTEDKVIINGIELSIHDELKYINPEKDNFNFNIFTSDSVWVKNIENDYITVDGAGGLLKYNKNDIFKVFTKVRQFNSNKKWTSWVETKDGFSYRTDNEHYTEVKKDGIKIRSSCHPMDKSSLAKGVAVCLQKIKNKKETKQEEFENSKISYDSRFDILYIDFVEQPTYGYSEWLEKGVYLRKDSETDEIIGIHIEEFVKRHIKPREGTRCVD